MLTKQPAFCEPIDGPAQPLSCLGGRNENGGKPDDGSDDCDTHTDKGKHILSRPQSVTGRGDGRTC